MEYFFASDGSWFRRYFISCLCARFNVYILILQRDLPYCIYSRYIVRCWLTLFCFRAQQTKVHQETALSKKLATKLHHHKVQRDCESPKCVCPFHHF